MTEDKISQWIQDLTKSRKYASKAYSQLLKLGAKSPELCLQLMNTFETTTSKEFRITILRLLNSIGEPAKIVLPLLIEFLKGPRKAELNSFAYSYIISILAQFKLKETLPLLMEFARDPDSTISSVAIQALADRNEPEIFQFLFEFLKEPNPDLVNSVIFALESNLDLEKNPQVLISFLLKELELNQIHSRKNILNLMSIFANETIDQQMAPHILRFLSDPDEEIHSHAENILQYASYKKFNATDEKLMEDLLQLVQNPPNPMTQEKAIEILSQITTEKKKVVSRVYPLFKTNPSSGIIRLVGELEIKEAFPDLILLLDRQELEIRVASIQALSRLNIECQKTCSALMQRCTDPEEEVVLALLDAFTMIVLIHSKKFPIKSVLPRVILWLSDPREKVSYAAISLVGRIGNPAKETVPILKRFLKETSEVILLATLNALESIEVSDDELISLMIPLLSHPNKEILEQTLYTLRALRPTSKEHFFQMLPYLKTLEEYDQEDLFYLIVDLGKEKAFPFSYFLEALQNSDVSIKKTVLSLLGELSQKESILPLISLLFEPNSEIFYEVGVALNQIFSRLKRKPKQKKKTKKKAPLSKLQLSGYYHALIQKHDWKIRAIVASDLGALQCTDKKMMNTLRTLCTDENENVRGVALGSLFQIDPTDKKLSPLLGKALKDEDQTVQLLAKELIKKRSLSLLA